jgi:hypothetical protein
MSPSHGRPGRPSHTQPQSSHREHFMACRAYPDFCHESPIMFDSAIPRFDPTVLVRPGVRRPDNLARRAPCSQSKFGRTSAPFRPHLASEQRFDVGKPDVIRPSVAADRDRVAAPIIGAIDQETANAGGAHFGEGDLLAGGFGHAPLKRGLGEQAITLRAPG